MNLSEYDVSVVPCKTYEPAEVRTALLQALEPVGGFDFLHPGMTVALKANLVSARKAETAATTHPVILAELTRLLVQRGAKVVLGDSPGGLFTAAALRHIYDVTGMREAESAGAELNENTQEDRISFPEALVAKTFSCTDWLLKADVIIDVCKLKTHGMMGMSAAAKNMFGAIPGTKKPEYHFRFPNAADFSDMIVDLDEYLKPVLCIADAVVGMEGNGPTQGTPRLIGALLASRSPHKLDLACAEILGMRPEEVPTLGAARKRGLIPASASQLSVFGSLSDFRVSDFEKAGALNDLTFRDMAGGGLLGKILGSAAGKILSSRPGVKTAECVGCGECRRVCPAQAIEMKKGVPSIDRSKCIRCFCCQEFCPKGAMKVQRSAIARMLSR